MQGQEEALFEAFETWWAERRSKIEALPDGQEVMDVRADFLDSFEEALRPVGLLDRFKVAGVIAEWWDDQQNDFKTLAAQGFDGVVDSWVTSIRDAAERDDKEAPDPFEHEVVPHLLDDYMAEIEEAEDQLSDAQSRKDSFEDGDPPDAEPVDDNWADGDEDRYNKYLDERIDELEAEMQEDTANAAEYQAKIDTCERQLAQYKQIKGEVTTVKNKVKDLREQLLDRLGPARNALTPEEETDLVLTVARTELADELRGYVDAHRQRVVGAFENWWDKYCTTMQDIKGRRRETTETLDSYLNQMGYADGFAQPEETVDTAE